MFSVHDREQLRDDLVRFARADDDVVGAALVGSAATGREDDWSDIDLVLQVRGGVDPDVVAGRWTTAFYQRHGAVHHLDVVAGGVLYRVYLLASSLQVDISFWPEDQFRGTEAGFTVLFGRPNPATEPRDPDPERLIGTAWLHGLHARSALARGRTWQAVLMLDGLRNEVVALLCLRHGLNPHHGREVDRLSESDLTGLAAARAHGIDHAALSASLQALVGLLLAEVRAHDPALADRLAAPLGELCRL